MLAMTLNAEIARLLLRLNEIMRKLESSMIYYQQALFAVTATVDGMLGFENTDVFNFYTSFFTGDLRLCYLTLKQLLSLWMRVQHRSFLSLCNQSIGGALF